jgi:hypothetical protein
LEEEEFHGAESFKQICQLTLSLSYF